MVYGFFTSRWDIAGVGRAKKEGRKLARTGQDRQVRLRYRYRVAELLDSNPMNVPIRQLVRLVSSFSFERYRDSLQLPDLGEIK